jgi:hypothetical protein
MKKGRSGRPHQVEYRCGVPPPAHTVWSTASRPISILEARTADDPAKGTAIRQLVEKGLAAWKTEQGKGGRKP